MKQLIKDFMYSKVSGYVLQTGASVAIYGGLAYAIPMTAVVTVPLAVFYGVTPLLAELMHKGLYAVNPSLVLKHTMGVREWACVDKDGFRAPTEEARLEGIHGKGLVQGCTDSVSFGAQNQEAYHAMKGAMSMDALETRSICVPYRKVDILLGSVAFTSGMFGGPVTKYGKGIEAVCAREYVNTRIKDFVTTDLHDQNSKWWTIPSVVLAFKAVAFGITMDRIKSMLVMR
jgi:hypothetical protein